MDRKEESIYSPLIATKMGFEESLPSYCFNCSVVYGSSFGGARSSLADCMILLRGLLLSSAGTAVTVGDERRR